MTQHCVDLNRCTESHLGQQQKPQRFVATKAVVRFFFFPFSFFSHFDRNKNINVFFWSERKQCKEKRLNLLQHHCKRSMGRIYWPAGVITLTGESLGGPLLVGLNL